jgi:hypothetical protein
MHGEPSASIGAEHALNTVLVLLLQDRTLSTVEAASLPWDRPVFLLRSAHMERMQHCLDVVRSHAPAVDLHVMSHAHDAPALKAMWQGELSFYPYPTPGRYSLDGVPIEMLERLRSIGFGTLVALDAGQQAEGLDATLEILAAIDESRIACFRADATFGRPADWRQRRLASAAYYRLVEWYHQRLDPDDE